MGARPAAAAAPPVSRTTHPGFDRARLRVAGLMTLVPAESFRADLEVFLPHLIGLLGGQVLDAEGDRIHADAIGELVHQDFGEETALRMARRAHRTLQARVDVNVLVHAPAVRE